MHILSSPYDSLEKDFVPVISLHECHQKSNKMYANRRATKCLSTKELFVFILTTCTRYKVQKYM